MHLQGWYLRRCMSMYNDIVRRPHLPREHAIRRIMSATGCDLNLYGRSTDDLEGDDAQGPDPESVETDYDEMEGEEEETLENDECYSANSDSTACVHRTHTCAYVTVVSPFLCKLRL